MSLPESDPAIQAGDADSVWTSPHSLEIPSADIFTYTFGNLSQYDNDDAIFIDGINPTNKISANQALQTVSRLVKGLKASGLEDGDCVCLHSLNNIWYPLIWLGIIGSGGRVVGSNPKYTRSELVHLLQLTKPKLIFAQVDCIDSMIEAASAVQPGIDPARIFTIDTSVEAVDVLSSREGDSTISQITADASEEIQEVAASMIADLASNDFKTTAQTNAAERTRQEDAETSQVLSMPSHGISYVNGYPSWRMLLLEPETDWEIPQSDQARIAILAMTSGTTGLPKAAAISHRSVVAQTALLEDQFRTRTYQPSQVICLPVFHAFASSLALVLPLRLGIPTFFLPRWTLPEYLRVVETHSITNSPVCPPIVAALAQLPVSDQAALQSLRCVVSAGAALPADVQNKLSSILAPEAVVTQCWGTTEAGWHSVGDPKEKDHFGSIGRLSANAQLKLVSDDGELVTEEGKPGEALIKTSTLFSGYLDDPDTTAQAFDTDGFYRTGDQVLVQGGKLYYQDRIKETMKVKGWQVSPTELESILIAHPRIADAAVVGVTRESKLGVPETFPTAYVVRSSDGQSSSLSGQDVKDFVAARVISYKRITGDVIFVKQITRSASGKILRRQLPEAEREPGNGIQASAAETESTSTETADGSWAQVLIGLWQRIAWW
ncbi:hypothetical protein H2200_013552 [Cladophialophora chaetospira]|uniref:Uncharacterized protein n=1 Tax=Cladophialophora chaetospira TaxID=386627 RepID=A0AA38UE74_9EURO|nr:hypothetical protein H2200_013552 [Cladophialophora chaetospira]